MQTQQRVEELNEEFRKYAALGKLEEVKRCLSGGAEIDSIGYRYFWDAILTRYAYDDLAWLALGKATALHYAAYDGENAVVNFLLEAGANAHLLSEKKKTVLEAAQLNNKGDTAALIATFLAQQEELETKAACEAQEMKQLSQQEQKQEEVAEEKDWEPEEKSDTEANILFQGKVFQFPMMALVVEEFVKQDGIMKYEVAKKTPGLLVVAEEFIQQFGGKIVFASHKWRQVRHPDDSNKTKFTQLKDMLTRKAMGDVKLIWLDYSCVPQDDDEKMQKAINSFADYVKCCNAFVMLIGNHGDATLQEYNKRGWCRLERIAACCAAIERNLIIYVHNATENRLLQAGNVEGALPRTCASVNPIEGDFTGDKISAVQRIVPVLRDLCQTMLDDPRDDYDHEIAIYITNQINDALSGKIQFTSKTTDELAELFEKASVLEFEQFFRKTMRVAEVEDLTSFEQEEWDQVKAELGIVATRRLKRHLQV